MCAVGDTQAADTVATRYDWQCMSERPAHTPTHLRLPFEQPRQEKNKMQVPTQKE